MATLTMWEVSKAAGTSRRSRGRLRQLVRLPVLIGWFVIIAVLVIAGQWDALHRIEQDANAKKNPRN